MRHGSGDTLNSIEFYVSTISIDGHGGTRSRSCNDQEDRHPQELKIQRRAEQQQQEEKAAARAASTASAASRRHPGPPSLESRPRMARAPKFSHPGDDGEVLACVVSRILSVDAGPGRCFCVPAECLLDRPATVAVLRNLRRRCPSASSLRLRWFLRILQMKP